MNRTRLRPFEFAVVVAALVASGATLAMGQQRPAAPVFTAQQATAGKIVYAKSCASCHMPDLSGSNEMPPLAGTAFMELWGTRSTKELFDYMSTAMPYSAPPLTTEAYTAIAAFILQSNGAVAGTQELRASTAVPINRLTAARPAGSP